MTTMPMSASPTRSTRPLLMRPAISLARREVTRFLRQKSRIVGAVGTPLLFWLVIGSGLRNSFRMPAVGGGMNYLQYAFPGTVVLILLFTAIFSMISVIEDRREGFLQAVLVAPVSRTAIVLGKVLGTTALAVGQAGLFLVLARLAGVPIGVVSFVAAFGVLILLGLALSGLGLLIAWPLNSTQGFHAVMNLLLMPMWLMSGAFFPADGASRWMGTLMKLNPLTYGVALLRHAMYFGASEQPGHLPSPLLCLVVTVGFAALMLFVATRLVQRSG